MDVYHNAPVSSALPLNSMEEDEDVSLEWLSIFVEDCLSSTTTYNTLQTLPTPNSTITNQTINPSPKDLHPPSKPRTKRRKTTQNPKPSSDLPHNILYDLPLLPQTQWLADSELIFPKKEPLILQVEEKVVVVVEKDGKNQQQEQQQQQQQQQQQLQQQPRRCSHCLSHRTPQWRAGPLGPKTLCNACGVRFKSGRLLPEYRPAKSPTFVSYKHSNSHKKVMEMRMSILPTNSN
ncbi:hypothetical protein J5N97_016083 [Dioscorea zingiberensis]|uniref:GATA-type domain-containing protein n=1 Tax=Dioscorea zingiberensis TaxID=325984 RepID=A0A9D5HFA4_9LILI|nr:hypothetical protein J5N97_016083 [Dioscorea zingiberensis]